jgi:hypothetical protein
MKPDRHRQAPPQTGYSQTLLPRYSQLQLVQVTYPQPPNRSLKLATAALGPHQLKTMTLLFLIICSVSDRYNQLQPFSTQHTTSQHSENQKTSHSCGFVVPSRPHQLKTMTLLSLIICWILARVAAAS